MHVKQGVPPISAIVAQASTKLVTHTLTVRLRFAHNGRCVTLRASPISVTVAPGGNQIGDVRISDLHVMGDACVLDSLVMHGRCARRRTCL
jgi:hypothetical protein